MKRTVSAIFVAILLASMLYSAFKIMPAEAAGTIYIRADGSIDPPTAPISTVDNVTYTFTDNINDSIVVERDNIIVDGAGHILEGFNSGYGFSLYGRVNVTIKKLHIANFGYGIYMDNSSGNSILANNLTYNAFDGIMLWNNSNGNSVTHNNITNSNYGISLGYSTNNNVLMNEISYNSYGINGRFFSSENNIIGNTVENNARNGIEFYGWDFSENLTISNNTIIGNGWAGLWLVSSANNNTVSSNYVAGNGYSGIELYSSSGNIITNNTITNNADNGILVESSKNTIIENNITLNHRYGLELVSSNNTIFNNSFEGNARTPQVYASGSTGNSWDNGYPSGGNYWSDYETRYPDASEIDGSGIWNIPYVIDENNQDNYPLVNPWTPTPPEFIGTVYIRTDGSIDPPDAPISTVDNVTYTLTGNITTDGDGIVVERDNIVIDGAGYMLQGTVVYPCRGISLSGRENVTVRNVQIENFDFGICLERYGIGGRGSSNNGISGNNITNNRWGIYLHEFSDNNKISGNNIVNNSYGVFFDGTTENNTVYGNNIVNNELGICLDGYISTTYKECPENNIICENNIVDNMNAGVKLLGLDNIFCHNNFLNNTIIIGSEFNSGGTNDPKLSKNILDDGYPSGGNYWGDYTGVDSDYDGIGGTQYIIDENNTDYYPLMGMFSDFKVTSEHHVQTVCNSSISSFQYNGTAISFYIAGDNGTTGFCRICIPTALMNTTYKVFVNGTEVSYNLLPCSNETHSYLYFNYTHSTQEVIIIPEFPSLLILSPLFMIATLLAMAICKRRKRFHSKSLVSG